MALTKVTDSLVDFDSLGITGNSEVLTITASTGTSQVYQKYSSTGGNHYIGVASSTGAGLLSNAGAYSLNIQTEGARNLAFGTNNALRTLIDSSGNVLFAATNLLSTEEGMRIFPAGSSGGMQCSIFNDNGGTCLLIGRGGSDGEVVSINRGSTKVGSITVTGSATAFNTSSDYRLKENVVTDWDATTRLKQLRPSRFNFISDADTTVDGFLAHEVSDIVPEAITGEKDATETLSNVVLNSDNQVIAEDISEDDWTAGKADAVLWTEEDELPEGVSVGDVRTKATYPSDSTWEASHTRPVYQAIDQSKLVPLLVKTIQELEARITTLENA